MLGKNTILKAIHNTPWLVASMMKVWMLGKNTILKAIHNNVVASVTFGFGVNAG